MTNEAFFGACGSSKDPNQDEIPLGVYLFLRICQANPKLRSVFGIPGDFSLPLLEHLYAESVAAKIDFVGFCNELNAAYATDGYARAMDSIGVLITTYGVGELSAINGIAGAFTEYAPVLHIVGTPSTQQMDQAGRVTDPGNVRNIHHLVQNQNSLLSPDYDIYKTMAAKVSVVQESLGRDVHVNLQKIDKVLLTVAREKRPGYLFVPCDISDLLVPSSGLTKTLNMSELRNQSLLEEISARILDKIYGSKKPSIMAEQLVDRFGAQGALDSFVLQLPSNFVQLFTSLSARNIDETLPNFIGVYAGKLSSGPEVIEALENNTDFLLSLGYANDEINSGVYSTDFANVKDHVVVHPDYVYLDGCFIHIKDFETGERQFSICDLIGRLSRDFNANKLIHNVGILKVNQKRSSLKLHPCKDTAPESTITQNRLIEFFTSYLKPNDILVCETCSFLFGVYDVRFPKGVKFFAQNLYESIGYAIPATFGIARAQRDLDESRRIILIQGDGSAQMTVQELSTYLRYDIQAPEIFLLNNKGYTVERIIKGPTRSYNDIQDKWAWTELFKVFGDESCQKHASDKINTMLQLRGLMDRGSSARIQLHELKLEKLDIPQKFRILREGNYSKSI